MDTRRRPCQGLLVEFHKLKLRVAWNTWANGDSLGKRYFYYSTTWIVPHISLLCGIFVYRDMTSAVTKNALGGNGGKSFQKGWWNAFCFVCVAKKLVAKALIKWVI